MKSSVIKVAGIICLFVAILCIGVLCWQKILFSQHRVLVTKDYKNLTYTIENQPIALVNGYSEIETAPGSASKITTRYFGNEAFADINNDSQEDVVFLLTQNTGGSGTFYYLAGAIKTAIGYQSTNTIFLGDRIAPQTTRSNQGIITVNYAVRKPGEPMSTMPSVGVSKYFIFQDGNLIEESAASTFGVPIEFTVGKEVSLTPGFSVTLVKINDSRCKPGVVCIWAGELSPVFNVSYGNEASESIQITLGTVREKQSTKNGYTFILQNATGTTATIIITKESNFGSLASCYISGCSGEICSDQEGVTSACIYKPEYACYTTATCVRQAHGQCGWTQTSALAACLQAARQ
jgi:hypothetical protein